MTRRTRATTTSAPGRARGHRAGAVGYLRRSTDRQEQSIPDQRRAIEAWAEGQGISLIRFYTDDAISGTSAVGRKAFQKLMADAQTEACDFGLVVVYDVKRFGRVDNDEAGYYRHLLRRAGVEVRYVSENFSGDGTDDLLRPVKQWQAREESKDLSKVTIRGLLTKSGTGHWMGGAPPYGYDLRYQSQGGQFLFTLRYLPDGSKSMLDERGALTRTLARGETVAVSRRDHCGLIPGDPQRVKIVRSIFRGYVEDGRGFKAIADRLNATNVPPARGPAWAAHYSGLWAMTTVRAILVNPAYCGDMVWNRRTDARFHRIEDGRAIERREVVGRRLEPNDPTDWLVVKDAHPAIVPRALWDAAQERLTTKPASETQRGVNPRTGLPVEQSRPRKAGWTGPRAKFMLSGLCACVRCGSRYEGYTLRGKAVDENGKREKTLYYACGGSIRRGRHTCALGAVPRDELESAVVEATLAFYARYEGAAGERRLLEAASGGLLLKQREASRQREQAERAGAKIDETIRKLLDNLTPTNRAHVDRRIRELDTERADLESRVTSLSRQEVTEAEAQRAASRAAEFLDGLPRRLRQAELADRMTTVRRCVERVVIDSENRLARVAIWTVPTDLGRCDPAKSEEVEVAIGDAAKRRGSGRRRR